MANSFTSNKYCCCCCLECESKQVFMLLSSGCLFVGVMNMFSYPMCLPLMIASFLLTLYYLGCGVYLIMASIERRKRRLFFAVPWLMLFSYIPITAFLFCFLTNLKCIESWVNRNYTSPTSEKLKTGLIALHATFCITDFLFSTYAIIFSVYHLGNQTIEDDVSV